MVIIVHREVSIRGLIHVGLASIGGNPIRYHVDVPIRLARPCIQGIFDQPGSFTCSLPVLCHIFCHILYHIIDCTILYLLV